MNTLSLKDSGVIYDTDAHTYFLNGRQLKGITGTLIERAYPKSSTYAEVAPDVLNHAAERGKACHQAVGNYYTLGIASTGYENTTKAAIKLLQSKGLTPVRFEYVVTDCQHYASPIDIICTDKDGNIAIVDMKFTSKFMYERVSLQTSIYKRFFHIINPDLKAESLYALHIHTNDKNEVLDGGIYDLTPVSDEFLNDLIMADQADTAFSVEKYYGSLPAKVNEVEGYLVQLQELIREKTDEMNNIKDGLCRLMMENKVKQYASAHIKLTLVTPKPRVTFDTKIFKVDHPDLFEQYSKTLEVKPSVRFTIK